MLLDELQQTWKAQPAARISVDPKVLLQTLRRNQRDFRLTIFWRDFREVIVAAALTVFFTLDAFRDGEWTGILLVVACVWVGGFILVDRFRRRGKAASYGDSLIGCVDASLDELEHQIWLLSNVLWWYLLPLFVALEISFGVEALEESEAWARWLDFVVSTTIVAVVFGLIYWLNQYAVRNELEPRRQELLAIRENLMWNRD